MFKKGKNIHIDFYQNRILEKYAQRDPKSVTLKQLTMFGRQATKSEDKLVQSANYVREELPVRLAHRIRMFQQLPFVVGTNPNMETCYNLYWDAFDKFRVVKEITSLEENKQFCDLIERMLQSHKVVIPLLVLGIYEAQKYIDPKQLNRFMNETLQSRVSRRVLAEQHLSLSKNFNDHTIDHQNQIGVVNNQCKALDIVRKCVKKADELFLESFENIPPQVVIDGKLDTTFTYIPEHIEYILFELIKNSMRYTAESHTGLFPPIRITIGYGYNQVMFRVSDQGGGIKKDLLPNIWTFVKPENTALEIVKHPELVGRMDENIPMKLSMGIGLPMSRVYANYWGGNMSLYSMTGYGTDVYVTLNVSNSFENLNFSE